MNKHRIIHCFDAGMPQALGSPALAGRFHYWRGKSGERRLFTRFLAAHAPQSDAALAVLVAARSEERVPLWVGPAKSFDLITLAQEKGANEVHLHYIAHAVHEEENVLNDLVSVVDEKVESLAAKFLV